MRDYVHICVYVYMYNVCVYTHMYREKREIDFKKLPYLDREVQIHRASRRGSNLEKADIDVSV